jgi:hypothetical protein
VAQKTIGELDAATTPLDGTEEIAIEQSAASKRATVADLRGQGISIKTASYTILDVDADVFEFSGASADGTFTGPTLADNFGRVLEIHNADPTYKLTFDPEGAETVDGNASIVLPSQYNYLKVRAGTSGWHVLEMKVYYDSGWVNQADLTDLTTTITHNLGVTVDQLAIVMSLATASDGTGAVQVANAAMDRAAGADQHYGVHFQGSSANAIVLQTGATGLLKLDATGGTAAVTGAMYDYYRVVITRIK